MAFILVHVDVLLIIMTLTQWKISPQLAAIFLASMALALWLLKWPYYGLWHDEIFYGLIALDYLRPTLYRHDLFFLYGSQSNYTLFTPFLAWWIKSFGLDNGLFWATVWGQTLWLCALVWLVTGLLPRRLWAWALLVVAISPPYYSEVFSYGEAFSTPRLYSEAIVLLGLGALLRDRDGLAWLTLVVSLLIHPLMGLPAIGLALIYKIRNPRIWLALIVAGSTVTLGLAIYKLGPFATMGQILASQFVDFERHRSPWLFIDQWPWNNLSIALYDLIILAMAICWLDRPLAKLAQAAFIIALTGLTLAVLADISNYSLLLGLQTARVLWVTQLLAAILWFPLITQLWEDSKNGQYVVILLACGLIGSQVAMAPLALLALAYKWGSQHLSMLRSPNRLIQLAIWLFPIQVLISVLANAWLSFAGHTFFEQRPIWLVLVTTLLSPALAAGALLWIYRPRARALLEICLAIAAFASLFAGVSHWDMRKYGTMPNSTARQQIILPLQNLITPGAVVYWENGIDQAWFWLRRANYISTQQLAGTIFNPQTAQEGMRRMEILSENGFPDSAWDFRKTMSHKTEAHVHDLSSVTKVCADPIIHTLILQNAVPGLVDEYHFVDPNSGINYFTYDCQPLRNAHAVLKRIR